MPISARSRTTGLVARLPGSVEAAGRVPLEVDRYELVARRAHRPGDAIPLAHQSRDIRRLDLDPGYVTVVAHANLREAEGLERGLGGFNLPEGGDRHLGAVWDARGQAGERRLVPVRQPKGAGGRPDLRLAH